VCILQPGQKLELQFVVSHTLGKCHHLPQYAEVHTP
jgi:hypothetical protein